MRPARIALALCLAVLSAAACSRTTEAPAQAAETTLSLTDDGKSVDLARGGTLTVKLALHGGTGYGWSVVKVDGPLAQQGDRTTETASQAPGAEKVQVFRFTATGAGAASVDLALRRSFEKDEPPAKTFHAAITIK